MRIHLFYLFVIMIFPLTKTTANSTFHNGIQPPFVYEFCQGNNSHDPNDDHYDIIFIVNNTNPGPGASYQLDDGFGVSGPYNYGTEYSLPFPADGHVHSLVFTDDDSNCSTTYNTIPLHPCCTAYDSLGFPIICNEVIVDMELPATTASARMADSTGCDSAQTVLLHYLDTLYGLPADSVDFCNCGCLASIKFDSDSIDIHERKKGIEDDLGVETDFNYYLDEIDGIAGSSGIGWTPENIPLPDTSYSTGSIFGSGIKLDHAAFDSAYFLNNDSLAECDGFSENSSNLLMSINGYDHFHHSMDFVAGEEAPLEDYHGHETHIANIIDNVAAHSARLRVSKIISAAGSGTKFGFLCASYNAINYNSVIAADSIRDKIKVINASLSWKGDNKDNEIAEKAMAETAANNIAVVAAAGNDTMDLNANPYVYPVCIASEYIVGVGANDPSDNLAFFSNFGNEHVGIYASGLNIKAAIIDGEDAYGFKSGTSSSAAFVSGELLYLAAKYPSLGMDMLIDSLYGRTASLRNIYVDPTATGANNGTSWADAFTDLQDALPHAAAKTVHIAKGVYLPGRTSRRAKSFQLLNGVTLLGGYPSGGGGSRDPARHVTLLSGDIDGIPGYGGNSYHVVSARNISGVTLDGIAIKHGNAGDENSFARSRGAGIYCSNSSLTLKQVNVSWNRAVYGGGIFATLSDKVIIQQSEFKNNRADYGSAIYHSNRTNLHLMASRVTDNHSLIRSALEVSNSFHTRIQSSLFANNLSKNSNAISFIATTRNQSADIVNSTIIGGTKDSYLLNIQVGYGDSLELNIHNSIIAHQDTGFARQIVVYNNNALDLNTDHCYIQGASVPGTASGNLYEDVVGDALFNADFSLDECSPLVNAGNNVHAADLLTDIEGNSRLVGTVDIGAFESQVYCPDFRESGMVSDMHIYPNPTSDRITLGFNANEEKEITILVLDMMGRRHSIRTERIKIGHQQFPVDFKGYNAGIYWVSIIIDGRGKSIHKVVKY